MRLDAGAGSPNAVGCTARRVVAPAGRSHDLNNRRLSGWLVAHDRYADLDVVSELSAMPPHHPHPRVIPPCATARAASRTRECQRLCTCRRGRASPFRSSTSLRGFGRGRSTCRLLTDPCSPRGTSRRSAGWPPRRIVRTAGMARPARRTLGDLHDAQADRSAPASCSTGGRPPAVLVRCASSLRRTTTRG
jgi:hypothetical protein